MLKAAAKAEVEGTLLHVDSAAVSMGAQRTMVSPHAGDSGPPMVADSSHLARLPSGRPIVLEAQQVLLIDGNRDLCTELADYLAAYGYAVTAAFSSRSGIEHVVTGRWQAIILDLALPGQDSFEVLRRIRSR